MTQRWRETVRHGTYYGYARQGCHCADCRAASVRYKARRRQQRRQLLAEGLDDLAHGRATTYKNWGCRCGPCTQANTVYNAPYKAAYTARQRAAREAGR